MLYRVNGSTPHNVQRFQVLGFGFHQSSSIMSGGGGGAFAYGRKESQADWPLGHPRSKMAHQPL